MIKLFRTIIKNIVDNKILFIFTFVFYIIFTIYVFCAKFNNQLPIYDYRFCNMITLHYGIISEIDEYIFPYYWLFSTPFILQNSTSSLAITAFFLPLPIIQWIIGGFSWGFIFMFLKKIYTFLFYVKKVNAEQCNNIKLQPFLLDGVVRILLYSIVLSSAFNPLFLIVLIIAFEFIWVPSYAEVYDSVWIFHILFLCSAICTGLLYGLINFCIKRYTVQSQNSSDE